MYPDNSNSPLPLRGKDARIAGSFQRGSWTFPTRADYEAHLVVAGAHASAAAIWEDEELAWQVQRHWHGRGQNGCQFAQAAALADDEFGWDALTILGTPDTFDSDATVLRIASRIDEAIQEPGTEVLSLLFPGVASVDQLLQTIDVLLDVPQIFVEAETAHSGGTDIAMRAEIDAEGTVAWLMGFGPFPHLPNTRQAPMLEIAVRVKPKPEEIFHRLNQDRTVAHLADVQLGIDDRRMEARWQGTLRRTRIILESEPDSHSAAKVTFTLPTRAWMAHRFSA